MKAKTYIKYIVLWLSLPYIDLMFGNHDMVSKGYDKMIYIVTIERALCMLLLVFTLSLFSYKNGKLSVIVLFVYLVVLFVKSYLFSSAARIAVLFWDVFLNSFLPYHSDSLGWMVMSAFYFTIIWIAIDYASKNKKIWNIIEYWRRFKLGKI